MWFKHCSFSLLLGVWLTIVRAVGVISLWKLSPTALGDIVADLVDVLTACDKFRRSHGCEPLSTACPRSQNNMLVALGPAAGI